jgi:1-acyl-sn-glycerol-3-phosphate acyltransferase
MAWRYRLARTVIRLFLGAYLRFRREGFELLPQPPYLICFNHLSWLDPFVLMAAWPERPRVHVFGPREEDMQVGLRNRLIRWIGTGVPFRPAKDDLLRSTRRATAVLAGGEILSIAGEGRLSEDEAVLLPISDGAAFIALRAQVPLVPVAINGTRWLRFGKTIRLRVGEPLQTAGSRADRATVDRLTGTLQVRLAELVQGYPDTRVPGPFGRWLTELFNERPWRTE